VIGDTRHAARECPLSSDNHVFAPLRGLTSIRDLPLGIGSEGLGLLWNAQPVRLRAARRASWSWRADAGVGPTDLAKKGRNVSFLFWIEAGAKAARAAPTK